MLEQIRSFFSGRMDPNTEENPVLRQKRIALATAALLLEMANADSDFKAVERAQVLDILKNRFDLSPSDTAGLIDLAEQERQEALDIWQFTNLINSHYDNREKLELLEILWRIVYVDGKVDMYEEYLMRKLSNLLNMDHSDLISAKFRAQHNRNTSESED